MLDCLVRRDNNNDNGNDIYTNHSIQKTDKYRQIREVKRNVYGKRQTAKLELLVSDFSRLYNLGKLFAFTVIKGFFSYFSTGFI